jgi:hypothetical protein
LTTPAPLILGASVGVLSAVARLEAAIAARLASSGAIARVVRAARVFGVANNTLHAVLNRTA